jgi:hypothetical protein
MKLNPPSGSMISVTTDVADPVIIIPHRGGGVMRYFTGLFMLFWLGMWFVGLSTTISKLMSGGLGSDGANFFVIFWLGGWTLGGGMVMLMLYRTFRPSVPESLRLTPNGVEYDSGIPPFELNNDRSRQKDFWRSDFSMRTRVSLDRRQLQSLHLRETDSGNRLTVDVAAARIDMAKSANEIEREWLYQLLANHYALPQVPAGERVAAKRA